MGFPKSKVGNILAKATAQIKILWFSDQDQPTLVYDGRLADSYRSNFALRVRE